MIQDYVNVPVSSASSALHALSDTPLSDDLKRAKMSMLAIPAGSSRERKSGRRGTKDVRPWYTASDIMDISQSFDAVGRVPRLKLSSNADAQCQITLTFMSNAWLTSSVTVQVRVAQSFQLSSFNSYTNMTTVFDSYKIEMIEAILTPQAATTVAYPLLTTVTDFDDASTPGSFANVQDRPNSLTTSGGAGHYHRFRPYVAVALYSGAFSSFGSEPSQWIDCASPNVQHYGLKAALDVAPSVYTYDLAVRAVVSFRGGQIS